MNTDAIVEVPAIANKDLLIPYFAPYFAYVAVASLPEKQLAPEWNYALRLLVVLPLLAWGRRRYVPLSGPNSSMLSCAAGVGTGLVGTVLWIALLFPFTVHGGTPWSDAAFVLRLVSAAFVVPLFEELVMRGYVLRFAFQWDVARKRGTNDAFDEVFFKRSINRVEPGSWTPLSVALSSVVFTLGHQTIEWPAAFMYGILMAALWIIRKDLLSCIVAHGVTNFSLALYVRATGQWGFW